MLTAIALLTAKNTPMPKRKSPSPADLAEKKPSAQKPETDSSTPENGMPIDLLSSQLISLVLPSYNRGDTIRLAEEVTGYTYEVSSRPQNTTDYFFRIIVDVAFTIHFEDETTLKASAQSVTDFKALIEAKEGVDFMLKMLPPEAQEAAVAIAYATTRGLLIAKSSGTILEDAVLPIVAPRKLMIKK